MCRLLYLDQNYLSGIAKRKPAFVELAAALREAVARGAVAVVESTVHERESRPRPELRLLELLRGFSGGRRLADDPDKAAREVRRRMARTIEREFPERRGRAGDDADLDALSIALTRCDLVTCDAFMADVIRRTRLDLRHGCELFSGRRADVLALRDRLIEQARSPCASKSARRLGVSRSGGRYVHSRSVRRAAQRAQAGIDVQQSPPPIGWRCSHVSCLNSSFLGTFWTQPL